MAAGAGTLVARCSLLVAPRFLVSALHGACRDAATPGCSVARRFALLWLGPGLGEGCERRRRRRRRWRRACWSPAFALSLPRSPSRQPQRCVWQLRVRCSCFVLLCPAHSQPPLADRPGQHVCIIRW
ncbi:hypothetical protein BDV95DRAFT_253100 [Massariosphaeria phaeospora]|uniref:Secreted protein n=1 Tax=Massariosphaeria phaeospora TaxID=100035 RepID=A0A7C8I575_9PLEO|nr:hypothetical protein BDV95DRAFT_253100 [Massariosphaeria phaeospora]